MGAFQTKGRIRHFSLCLVILLVGCASQPTARSLPSATPHAAATVKPKLVAASTLAPRPIVAPYTLLRVGQQAVLQETQNGRTVICSSAALWIQYDNSDPHACSTEPSGARVTLLQIGADSKHLATLNKPDPLVQIQANDGSWTGWTDLTTVNPLIPPGSPVRLELTDGQVTALSVSQTPDGGDESIGDDADAAVIRQGTGAGAGFTLVRLARSHGSVKGGWTLTASVHLRGSTLPLDIFISPSQAAAYAPSQTNVPKRVSAVGAHHWSIAHDTELYYTPFTYCDAVYRLVAANVQGSDPPDLSIDLEKVTAGTPVERLGLKDYTCPHTDTVQHFTNVSVNGQVGYLLEGNLTDS